MRCERAQELFSEYCDGTLQPALRVSLDSHIASCESCRQEIDGLKQVWKMLDESPVVKAPPGFRAAILERIDTQEAAKSSLPWYRKMGIEWKPAFSRKAVAWGAAALLLIAVSGVVVPGRYTVAGISRGVFSAKSDLSFMAARPRIESAGETAILVIPLYLTDTDGKVRRDATQLAVRVLGGPVKLVADSSAVSYDGNNPALVRFAIVDRSDSSAITLEVRRLDGGDPSVQILTVPIPKP